MWDFSDKKHTEVRHCSVTTCEPREWVIVAAATGLTASNGIVWFGSNLLRFMADKLENSFIDGPSEKEWRKIKQRLNASSCAMAVIQLTLSGNKVNWRGERIIFEQRLPVCLKALLIQFKLDHGVSGILSAQSTF
jgi:hypothetical protein